MAGTVTDKPPPPSQPVDADKRWATLIARRGRAPLTLQEYAESLRVAGDPWGERILAKLDEAEQMDGVIYELSGPDGEPADVQGRVRALVTLETRLMTALEDFGAIDPDDKEPPDPIDVLRMLLG